MPNFISPVSRTSFENVARILNPSELCESNDESRRECRRLGSSTSQLGNSQRSGVATTSIHPRDSAVIDYGESDVSRCLRKSCPRSVRSNLGNHAAEPSPFLCLVLLRGAEAFVSREFSPKIFHSLERRFPFDTHMFYKLLDNQNTAESTKSLSSELKNYKYLIVP